MKSKPSYKSKGVWSGALLMLYAILGYVFYGDFNVEAFLLGLGILGIRQRLD